MPDALELPGMLRAVVPLMRGEGLARLRGRVVGELVALAFGETFRGLFQHTSRRLPRLAAVAGALDDLSEPSARLRRVQPVRIRGRSLHVIDLPPREMRAAHVPLLALAVPRQDERTLAGTHQHSYSAHDRLLWLRARRMTADKSTRSPVRGIPGRPTSPRPSGRRAGGRRAPAPGAPR